MVVVVAGLIVVVSMALVVADFGFVVSIVPGNVDNVDNADGVCWLLVNVDSVALDVSFTDVASVGFCAGSALSLLVGCISGSSPP